MGKMGFLALQAPTYSSPEYKKWFFWNHNTSEPLNSHSEQHLAKFELPRSKIWPSMWLCNHLCNANLLPAEWLQIYYLEQQITIYWAKLLRRRNPTRTDGKIFLHFPQNNSRYPDNPLWQICEPFCMFHACLLQRS